MTSSNQHSKVNKFFDLDYSEDDKVWLSNQNSLRKLVGILGMLLPVFLYLFVRITSSHTAPLESISHYYYTRAGTIFTIVVSLLAIFLLIYKGKETQEFIFSSIAGFAALCVLLFPTGNLADTCCDERMQYSVTFLDGTAPFRENFHYIAAAIFLGCLAYMSLFLFDKKEDKFKNMQNRKIARHSIYIVCGVVMFLALLIIFLGFLKVIPEKFYDAHNLTFWMEVVALESFGISWFIKGKAILKDRQTAMIAQ